DATREAFGAALEGVSFKGAAEGARVHINQWVEAQTEKRIQNLLPAESVNGLTRLVLVNAIYFLGDWLSPFEKDSTSPEPFYVSPAVHKDVPTMHELGYLPVAQRDAMKALELPYKGEQLSMLFLLPDRPDGLGALERSLSTQTLDAIVAALKPAQ